MAAPQFEEVFFSGQEHNNQVDMALHGVSLTLSSSYPPYVEHARSYLIDLLIEPGAIPSVRSRLHWNSKPPQRWSKSSVMRYGRQLLKDGSSLLLAEVPELPGLQLEVHWDGDVLELEAYFAPLSHFGGLALRLGQTQPRIFAILTYYLVYFPLIHFFNQTRGWHLLHAGGVVGPFASWILAGLPGSGKSTFTLALLTQPEMRLLSDNLLLYDDQHVYAFPEPLHLGETVVSEVSAEVKNLLINTNRMYSHSRKDYYPLPQLRRWQSSPEALFFLGQGENFETKPVPPAQAVERLINFDRMAKETAAYEQFAAALELISPPQAETVPGAAVQRRRVLETLVQSLDCSELWIKKGSHDEAVKWLCDRQYREQKDPGESDRA
jgi:hypothetical protein